MQKEQIEAIRDLGKRGREFGVLWDTILESAFFIHGHVCGGMPLGFRAGLAALQALGAERELNMAKLVVVETGLGCTFGKGLIQRAEYGKWALNLIERSSRRAVRVSVRPGVMQASFNSPFVKMRHQGVPPTKVPLEISSGLVKGILLKPQEELFTVSEVFDYPLPESPASSFNLILCSVCDEAVAENKVRLKDDKPVCLPCSGYAS
jgi:formylmethanofuran dehydrogenase subunit E